MLGRIQESEGRTFFSVSRKAGRDDYQETRSSNEPNGDRAVQKVNDQTEIRVCHGRTINLGNYESARISVSYTAMSDDYESAMESARGIVLEILAREVASLKGESRKPVSLGETVGSGAMVGLDYGLTLNLGNFESAKIDIGVTAPVGDEEAVEDARSRISESCENRVKDEVAIIRGLKGGDDLGF
jgi:hypothetical protein